MGIDAIGRGGGHDFMPFPFRHTKRSRFTMADEAQAYADAVPDRLRYGDLSVFNESATAYMKADIRVECHVPYMPTETASVRAIRLPVRSA
ncbi:hypothetical protein [Mycobacterium sp. URHB0021]